MFAKVTNKQMSSKIGNRLLYNLRWWGIQASCLLSKTSWSVNTIKT